MIHAARLINKEALTTEIYRLVYRLESGDFKFVSGQFVLVQAEINGELVKRAYSISSVMNDLPELELTVRRVPNGLMSNYLADMEIGQEIEFTGPLGHFSVECNKLSKVVLIANGCGIAPLKSMITYWHRADSNLRVSLFYGNSFINQIAWDDYFRELAQNWSNFHYWPCVSREDGAKVESGRVTEILPARYQDFADSEFYLCGSAAMIKEMRQLLVNHGASAENIRQEQVLL